MLRTYPQPHGWLLGPALAAGLTLRFYPTFNVCTTLPALRRRIAEETPEYDRWHIHGLVSQTADGELTLGDSHEYGTLVDIFNKAVIFDWAGTTVDHGSLAPVRVLTQIFAAHGITLSDEQARRDMGLLKRDHIERILALPEVTEQWTRINGASPGPQDLDQLFSEFAPLQMQCLGDYSRLIPGAAAVAAELRSNGLKIGGTTGYTRPMMEILTGLLTSSILAHSPAMLFMIRATSSSAPLSMISRSAAARNWAVRSARQPIW
jgi:hypothetical protein